MVYIHTSTVTGSGSNRRQIVPLHSTLFALYSITGNTQFLYIACLHVLPIVYIIGDKLHIYPYTTSPLYSTGVVSSGGAPTPAGTSVFTKHNWNMGMGYLWLNGWGIYGLLGWTFMT